MLLRNLEMQALGNPVMKLEEVQNLFETLIEIRRVVGEILFKEETYQTYKIETRLRFRREIGLGFILMTIFRIIIPLLTLFPPVDWFSWQIEISLITLTSMLA